MRILTLIVGATAAVGIAGAVSANQAPDRIHLAQAQDSGAPNRVRASGAAPAIVKAAVQQRVVRKAAARLRPIPAAGGPRCATERQPRAAPWFASALEALVSRFEAAVARQSACAPPRPTTLS
jgi:hypothetical protein